MIRKSIQIVSRYKSTISGFIQSKTFLTNAYRCTEAWNSRASSPILQKVNLENLYNEIDRNHATKGVMSAIDVDIFANSVKDGSYLEELRDLIHKLRLTAETGNTLCSTHYAVIRHFQEFGSMQDLLNILWDPLNYGIFIDDYTANILLDGLLNSGDYEKAAMIASLVMLQEEYTNAITCSLALYSSYKYLQTYKPEVVVETIKEEQTPKGKKAKVEEIKIRIKYLRNPYFDDHFDLTNHLLRAGKTLAWLSESKTDNLHNNLQLLGWFHYKKYDKLLAVTKDLSQINTKVYKEILETLKTHSEEGDSAKMIEECVCHLCKLSHVETTMENDLKVLIENAINMTQQNDIQQQEGMFKTWEQLRQEKLAEQTKRLDEARRIKMIEEKQEVLKEQEQKLWFFENEENMDLEIQKKFVYYPKKWFGRKKKPRAVDENYIPPEV